MMNAKENPDGRGVGRSAGGSGKRSIESDDIESFSEPEEDEAPPATSAALVTAEARSQGKVDSQNKRKRTESLDLICKRPAQPAGDKGVSSSVLASAAPYLIIAGGGGRGGASGAGGAGGGRVLGGVAVYRRPQDDGNGSLGGSSMGSSTAGFAGAVTSKNRNTTSSGAEAEASSTGITSSEQLALAQPPPSGRSWFNLFWIPRSDLPAIYFDRPDSRFTSRFLVMPICCFTYHYPVEVNTAKRVDLEPLSLQKLKNVTDERTHDFTLALIDFAKWCKTQYPQKFPDSAGECPQFCSEAAASSLSTNSQSQFQGELQLPPFHVDLESGINESDMSRIHPNELFPWPGFLLELVSSPKEWNAWRKDAERGGGDSRRTLYFRALKKHYEQAELRLKPQSGNEQEGRVQSQPQPQQQQPQPQSQSQQGRGSIRSFYSLFWIPRSNLPAIFYDKTERQHAEKFTVLPICCFTYHYPMEVISSPVQVQPFSPDKLQQCTDERTQDFTLAMLDFAQWHQGQLRQLLDAHKQTDAKEGKGQQELQMSLDKSSDPDEMDDCLYFAEEVKAVPANGDVAHPPTATTTVANASSSEGAYIADFHGIARPRDPDSTELDTYQWPEFILELLNHPVQWASWRKRAERTALPPAVPHPAPPAKVSGTAAAGYCSFSRSSIGGSSGSSRYAAGTGVSTSGNAKAGTSTSVDVFGIGVPVGTMGTVRRRQYFLALRRDYEAIMHALTKEHSDTH